MASAGSRLEEDNNTIANDTEIWSSKVVKNNDAQEHSVSPKTYATTLAWQNNLFKPAVTNAKNSQELENSLSTIRPSNPDSKPKLFYFNAQGRAEIIRLILSYLEVDYEDIRFRLPPYAVTDFEQFKKAYDVPFNQVPVLEIDGIFLAQSQAIVRYISRKYGLMGANELENSLADMIHCGTEDLRQKFTSAMFSHNGSDREQLARFKNEVCHEWASFFERLLFKNGSTWFVGKAMTYADLAVYDTISTISWRIPTAFENFQLLRDHSARIEALPTVAYWLKNRPKASV